LSMRDLTGARLQWELQVGGRGQREGALKVPEGRVFGASLELVG
jgi:hypothetical protein